MAKISKISKHVKHLARKHRVVQAEIAICLGSLKGEAIKKIRETRISRGRACTHKQAREAWEAAQPAVEEWRAAELLQDRRREARWTRPALKLHERRNAALTRLIGADLWRHAGGCYSGSTEWQVVAADRAEARTITSDGGEYSSRCQFCKTDAVHCVCASISGVLRAVRSGLPRVIDGQVVVDAERVRDGIFRVSLIGSAGKRARSREAFVADQGEDMYYVANTERGAATALNRGKRAKLGEATPKLDGATVRGWGWCREGISQWIERHGIRRDIPGRMRRGVRSAAIARLIAKHGGPRDAYETRLLQAAAE